MKSNGPSFQLINRASPIQAGPVGALPNHIILSSPVREPGALSFRVLSLYVLKYL